MLTRREVLQELQRIGITRPSQLKTYAKDFEKYMARNHDIFVSKAKKPWRDVKEAAFAERRQNPSSKPVNPLRLEKTGE